MIRRCWDDNDDNDDDDMIIPVHTAHAEQSNVTVAGKERVCGAGMGA